jgi:prephenate dehydrogenase
MDIFDPVVKYERINFRKKLIQKKPIYDVIILAVPHKKVMELLKNNINSLLKKNGLFIDLNYNFKQIDKKKYNYITL